MKTIIEKPTDVTTARASLEAARAYVTQTLATLEELRQRRAQIVADVEALAAKPPPWPEVVDATVAATVDSCAATYKPALVNHIRERNPSLAKRTGGYADFPFLRFPADIVDEVSSAAMCFFMGDILKVKLRELLLSFDPPHPADACVAVADRERQRADLDKQLRNVDDEIAGLQAELTELREGV